MGNGDAYKSSTVSVASGEPASSQSRPPAARNNASLSSTSSRLRAAGPGPNTVRLYVTTYDVVRTDTLYSANLLLQSLSLVLQLRPNQLCNLPHLERLHLLHPLHRMAELNQSHQLRHPTSLQNQCPPQYPWLLYPNLLLPYPQQVEPHLLRLLLPVEHLRHHRHRSLPCLNTNACLTLLLSKREKSD